MITELEIQLREKFSHGISRLEGFDFEVVQSTPEMLIYSGLSMLAKRFSSLKVVCGPKWML
jgi:hypothetical protein